MFPALNGGAEWGIFLCSEQSAEGAGCPHSFEGWAASSGCDLESMWESGGTGCTGRVNVLQYILCLSFMGGLLWTAHGDRGAACEASWFGGRNWEVPRAVEGFLW